MRVRRGWYVICVPCGIILHIFIARKGGGHERRRAGERALVENVKGGDR
jgi:hypothetical protein